MTSHGQTHAPDRRFQNGRGIVLMAGGMFVFSAVDTIAKLMTDSFHPVQIVWCRQLGLVALALVFLARQGPGVMKSARPGLQVLRGVCAVGSATAFIAAIAHVALADAVAVSFVAPFIVTVLGALVLGETVGIRRWVAVSIGFAATLIIIRPGSGVMHPAIVLVLVAAALFALRQIISRALGAVDATPTTIAYTGIVGVAVLSFALPFVWRWPETTEEIAALVTMACLAALAETLVIRALEIGESVAIAPVHYSILIWSTAYGFMVWGHLPDAPTLTGAAIIVATGIYTLNRERKADLARRGAG